MGIMSRITHFLGSLAGGKGPARLARAAARLEPLVRPRSGIDRAPASLFDAGAILGAGRPEVVLWLGSHDAPDIRIEPIEPREIAARMLHSLETERAPFLAEYQRFRFAFPDRVSPVVEAATDTQARLLERALADKPAWSVHHPYPVSIRDLCDAIEPILAEARTSDETKTDSVPASRP